MARIVPSLQLARTEDYCYTVHLHLHFHRSIENFSAYTILRAALFSAASPAERLRSAGSLAISLYVRSKKMIGIYLKNVSILASKVSRPFCPNQRATNSQLSPCNSLTELFASFFSHFVEEEHELIGVAERHELVSSVWAKSRKLKMIYVYAG